MLTSEIKVNILLDSLIDDIRVTTFELYYPRIIHAELMTHRVFSRNASSSRAIPVERMIRDHANYIPANWRENQKGMQPAGFLSDTLEADQIWKNARAFALQQAESLMRIGVAKEQANRLLEPFMFIKVLVTSTDYKNFFTLRSHKDAQWEIHQLSDMMKDLYEKNTPVKSFQHIPYFNVQSKINELMLKASVARCARVSYANHDGTDPELEKDLALFERLIISKPQHSSPAEHQVFSKSNFEIMNKMFNWNITDFNNLNGNLAPGVIQYRKIIERIYI